MSMKTTRKFQLPRPAQLTWQPACHLANTYDSYASRNLIPQGFKIREISPTEATVQFNFQHGFVAKFFMVNINPLIPEPGDNNWFITSVMCRFYSPLFNRQEKIELTLAPKELITIAEDSAVRWPMIIAREEITAPVARWFNDGHSNVNQVMPGQYGHATLDYCPFIEGDLERVIQEAWSLPNPYEVAVDEYC